MQAIETNSKKSAVQCLNFGAKTARRVTWESWEFTIVGPNQVRVTNASYGFLKDDHSYVVTVEERDGVVVPAACDCPADEHIEEVDCKHKVALATVGGPTVLRTATKAEAVCPNGDTQCGGPEGDDLPCFACFSLRR